MWTWKVTLQSRETAGISIIFGSSYPDPDTARWMLATWLRDKLPGLYQHKIVEAMVVNIPEKVVNDD